jgi:Flp pilus assembly protein TadB
VVVALIVIFRKPRESSRPSTVDKLDALRSWTRRLVDVLSSGSGGLEQAITSSARTAPPVLATEIQSLDVRVRTRGLELALRGFADDLADSAADAVVMAVILRCRTGGRGLVDVLSAQATALSDTIAVRRDIDADRAKATTAIRIIAGVTIVVCAGLFLFSGAYLAPFDSFLGQLVLAAILALFAAAMWWMHSLIRPPQTGRILVTSGTTPRQREALSHTGTRP